ncbi:hypothetical protein E4U54_007597 [Claviceps lovelessii]|nr:hypothetical protein E4U54_007597 [Claviceps lovelessii]
MLGDQEEGLGTDDVVRQFLQDRRSALSRNRGDTRGLEAPAQPKTVGQVSSSDSTGLLCGITAMANGIVAMTR